MCMWCVCTSMFMCALCCTKPNEWEKISLPRCVFFAIAGWLFLFLASLFFSFQFHLICEYRRAHSSIRHIHMCASVQSLSLRTVELLLAREFRFRYFIYLFVLSMGVVSPLLALVNEFTLSGMTWWHAADLGMAPNRMKLRDERNDVWSDLWRMIQYWNRSVWQTFA